MPCTAASEIWVRPHELAPLGGASWCCVPASNSRTECQMRLSIVQLHTGHSLVAQDGRPGHPPHMDMCMTLVSASLQAWHQASIKH